MVNSCNMSTVGSLFSTMESRLLNSGVDQSLLGNNKLDKAELTELKSVLGLQDKSSDLYQSVSFLEGAMPEGGSMSFDELNKRAGDDKILEAGDFTKSLPKEKSLGETVSGWFS